MTGLRRGAAVQELDEWGQDPQVRYLRGIFASLETAQKIFIEQAGIALFDERLRRFRESALHLFERAWMAATRKGITLRNEEFGILYTHCLAHFIQARGIAVPDESLAQNEKIETLLNEVVQ